MPKDDAARGEGVERGRLVAARREQAPLLLVADDQQYVVPLGSRLASGDRERRLDRRQRERGGEEVLFADGLYGCVLCVVTSS